MLDLAGREICIVVLSGRVNVDTGAARFDGIGERASVFDDRGPYAVYAPDGAGVTIEALTPAEIGVASAPGGGALPPRLIEPSTMRRSVRGQGANTRYVRDILPQTTPAEHLLVVEVRTPSGHSSSYPPHKHDTRQRTDRELARGDLLPPSRSAAGLRLPARLHRRPLARRGDAPSRTTTS